MKNVNLPSHPVGKVDIFDKVVTCGERCHGEVSADFSVSSDGSKSAEVEVEVESESGNTNAEVRVGGSFSF